MTPKGFILASGSPRRSELLRELGIVVDVIPSQAEEIQPDHLTPREICEVNAHRKALQVAENHPEHLVLGADTLVFLDRTTYGKPSSMDDARRILSELSGRTHHVITGVCLLHLKAGRRRVFSVSTAVTFKTLSLEQINAYFAKVNPLDKAGAYGIQAHGDLIVASTEGSFTNVVGLPMETLRQELERFPYTMAPGK